MARKEATVHIKAAGRDTDKVFRIVEASAAHGEDWALRLFLAIARSGIEIPENIANAGLAGVAFLTLNMLGRVRYEDAAPLLAEMMDCVQIVPDPKRMEVTRKLVDDDIEEVKTRLQLRREVAELHTGFSLADALSKVSKDASAKKSPSSSTSTSRGQ